MCTRPDRYSLPTSLVATRDSIAALVYAAAVMIVAAATTPARWAERRRASRSRQASAQQVDIQIHLEDARCVAELRRLIRQTLRRAARTWAPLPLPVDRIVAGVGYPCSGKVDLYDHFPESADQRSERSRRLVVISLGLREGERELEAAEVAGALAAQIQAVIDDLYRDTKPVVVGPPAETNP